MLRHAAAIDAALVVARINAVLRCAGAGAGKGLAGGAVPALVRAAVYIPMLRTRGIRFTTTTAQVLGFCNGL